MNSVVYKLYPNKMFSMEAPLGTMPKTFSVFSMLSRFGDFKAAVCAVPKQRHLGF